MVLGAGALACVPAATWAQVAQDRITVVAPFPPGGPVDTLARLLADGLSRRANKPALVENVPGGAGNIGIERVKRARPDGQTLLVIPAGNLTINPTLMTNFPFDIERDFTAVTMLATAPNVLVAGPGAKVKDLKDLKDLLAQAKARPGAFSFASPGVGSGLHLAGELFKQQAGVDLLHVPYKGTGPALNDVLGGNVPLMFSNLPATLGHIRSGKLLALGITDKVRTPVAPEIPTLMEQGVPGVVVTSWYGLMAPAGTPPELAARLARDAQEILSPPQVQEQLKSQGLQTVRMTPAEYAAHIKAETATWAGVIRSRNIKAE
ncbi:Bug family tripartite tricarboxylate transporter substrate binding protein [Ramlibacter aurantiacus]|uniref:Bug family tripartite tricarboxylate transporter substrate binding protein n=1 Tax=Ramlibacter aurantiacus TaxID=2801330 RepID=UPI003F4946E3